MTMGSPPTSPPQASGEAEESTIFLKADKPPPKPNDAIDDDAGGGSGGSSAKTPPVSAGKRKITAKRSRIGKKPADMPRRPLSGYNFFFSEQKTRIMEEQSRVKDEKRDIFTTLGRIVAERWKKTGEKDKEKYNALAAKDLIRYRKEMDKYNEKIAMRNRKESELLGESGKEEYEVKSRGSGAAASPATSASISKSLSNTAQGEHQQVYGTLSGLSQMPFGDAAMYASSVGHMAGMQQQQGYSMLPPQFQQGYAGLLGGNQPFTGAGAASGLSHHDLGRLTLTQHHNLAARMDPGILGRSNGLDWRLPPTLDQFSRANALYPQRVTSLDQRSAMPLGYTSSSSGGPSPSQMDVSSLLSHRISDATLLSNLNNNPSLQGFAGPGESSNLLEQLQQQQQQLNNESIRQAYARLLQQQQADEETRRLLLQQGFRPSEGPGSGAGSGPSNDGRFPY